MLSIIALLLAVVPIWFSRAAPKDFLFVFLLWLMEVSKYYMSLERHLQLGHGNIN